MLRVSRELDIQNVGDWNAIHSISCMFSNAGKELHLVGGCIRDLLLGLEPKDYDMCTNAAPEEVVALGRRCGYGVVPTGLKHGTVTLVDKGFGKSFEVTTYRVDGGYSDSRHPDNVMFTSSLEDDLSRRDFTINSFAYDFLKKELIALDESHLMDLELGIVRCVGDPNKRFQEDALRMLRAIRFSSQLGFTIEEGTYNAILANSSMLSSISRERIRDELTKILLSDNPQGLELFALSGLEQNVSGLTKPYLLNMLNCEHGSPWHYADVFHHTMDVVKMLPKDFDLRWAGLLHDIGKPYVKKRNEKDDDGSFVYHNHPEESERIAKEVMALLKFPNGSIERISRFVGMHDLPLDEMSMRKFKKAIVAIGREDFKDYLKLRHADACAHRLLSGSEHLVHSMTKIKERYAKVLSMNEPLEIKDLAVDGNDLMSLGISGKEIGDCLSHLLDRVLSEPHMNKKWVLKSMAHSYIVDKRREGGER